MCTALSLNTIDHYFGRTLDLDRSYGEEVCILPGRCPIELRRMGVMTEHYAIIGMATVVGGVPLFYDGANEHGLAMAGLNFPGNAYYPPEREGLDNITPFEFIPWILGKCRSVPEAEELISRMNLADIPFSAELPLSPLHWMISDRDRAIVVEWMSDGPHIHEDPAGVMTNNPPFEYQLFNLNNYRRIGVDNGDSIFSSDLNLTHYCQGLGGLGLPGDLSSMSRFVRAAFGRANSVSEGDESSSVSQFFHLLGYVEMPRGLCRVPGGHYDITVYTSCINTTKGIYYYTTYGNCAISCVDMRRVALDSDTLFRYPLVKELQIKYQN